MHPDPAAARRARRRQQDVEVARQLRRHHRAAGGDVRQADVDFRRADVALLRAAVVSPAGRDRGAQARMRRRAQSARGQGAAGAGDRCALSLAPRGGRRARRVRCALSRQGALPESHAGRHAAHRTEPACPIAQLAKQAGIVASTSEALRLIAQRGLKLDGDVVTDKVARRCDASGGERGSSSRPGKRKFARVTVGVDPVALHGDPGIAARHRRVVAD